MIGLILTLAVVGCVLYLIETLIPMDAAIRTLIRVLIVLLVIWYLIGIFGVDLPLPRFHRVS